MSCNVYVRIQVSPGARAAGCLFVNVVNLCALVEERALRPRCTFQATRKWSRFFSASSKLETCLKEGVTPLEQPTTSIYIVYSFRYVFAIILASLGRS